MFYKSISVICMFCFVSICQNNPYNQNIIFLVLIECKNRKCTFWVKSDTTDTDFNKEKGIENDDFILERRVT